MIIVSSRWKNEDMPPEATKYNKYPEVTFLKAALVIRAFENTYAIVFYNTGGPVEEIYVGLSQVTLPLVGTVPGSFDNAEIGMRLVEVDMNTVDIAEKAYNIREDMARPGWHYDCTHD